MVCPITWGDHNDRDNSSTYIMCRDLSIQEQVIARILRPRESISSEH